MADTPIGQGLKGDDVLVANAKAQEESGTSSPTTLKQYREAYGPREGHYPGPWPEPDDAA